MTTKIQWCTETWNPLVGCSKISAGCSRCYAAVAAKSVRLQQFSQYQKVKDWDGTIEFVENQLLKPLSWKASKQVFVCSMSDIFHANVKDEWLDKIFAVMAIANQHTFQVLTKRPFRMKKYLDGITGYRLYQALLSCYWEDADFPRHILRKYPTQEAFLELFENLGLPDRSIPNIWLGTSVENQKAADDRIPSLLQTPAAVRFLSCEPLLESIDLRKYLGLCSGCQTCEFHGGHRISKSMLGWIIAGGESGSGARPCHVDSIRSIVRQCKLSETAVFVKQLGSTPIESNPYIAGIAETHRVIRLKDRKGGNIDEFPQDLRIREFPN
jgi:protein gp37